MVFPEGFCVLPDTCAQGFEAVADGSARAPEQLGNLDLGEAI
jgi:hypothetical protein